MISVSRGLSFLGDTVFVIGMYMIAEDGVATFLSDTAITSIECLPSLRAVVFVK